MGPFPEQVGTAPVGGDEAEDVKIGQGLAGGAAHLGAVADAAFGIDEASLLFTPAGGWQHKVGAVRGFGAAIHVLNDDEVEAIQQPVYPVLIDPGMAGVGGDEPQCADPALFGCLQDLIVGETGAVGDAGNRDAGGTRHFFAVTRVGEVVAAEQVGRVAEQP